MTSSSSDDEEDQCPLCIEDMDVTDKSFKPCPCGFQICQFCYNKIRSGPDQYNRCPACRRPYDDESIEYTTVTAEDLKREQERKQRKEQERKQRERERNKEQSHHSLHGTRDKKHLASMRVIQKNLVYVIGLNPSIPSEELQQMLRKDEFFGQYGKIQKIVINKRMNSSGHPGVGVYVTFARKEDAARCIAAVDGSVNDGKYLRAAYGTTKYCSSYLRGQNCPNPNCMFLHEPGEEADSFNKHQNPPSSSSSGSQSTNSPQPINTQLAGQSPVRSTAQAAPAVVAANAPALPAWGKATPYIPPVQRIKINPVQENNKFMVEQLQENLKILGSSNKWHLEFVSLENENFPAMFSLPLDEKKRVKLYNKAVQELDKLSEKTSSEKKNNSQQLLAQLLKKPEGVY